MSTKSHKQQLKDFFSEEIWPLDFIKSPKFLSFINKIPESVFISDVDGNIVQANYMAAGLLGYDYQTLFSLSIEELVPPEKREKHVSMRKHYFEHPTSRLMGESKELKLQVYTCEKEIIPIDAALFTLDSDQGPLAVNFIRDISKQEAHKNRLLHRALYDSLTTLPNRYYLSEMFPQMQAQAKRMNHCLMLLILDLDKFKPVNDTYGHGEGDQLLIILGKRFEALRRKNDFLARLGGDEFVCLAIIDNTDCTLAERILECCRKPFKIDNHIHQVSASIGVVFDQQGNRDYHTLMNEADKKLYAAKQQGGDQYIF